MSLIRSTDARLRYSSASASYASRLADMWSISVRVIRSAFLPECPGTQFISHRTTINLACRYPDALHRTSPQRLQLISNLRRFLELELAGSLAHARFQLAQ